MAVRLLNGSEPEMNDVWGIERQLATGEGTTYRGAPNVGVPAGPATSPQLPAALKEI